MCITKACTACVQLINPIRAIHSTLGPPLPVHTMPRLPSNLQLTCGLQRGFCCSGLLLVCSSELGLQLRYARFGVCQGLVVRGGCAARLKGAEEGVVLGAELRGLLVELRVAHL